MFLEGKWKNEGTNIHIHIHVYIYIYILGDRDLCSKALLFHDTHRSFKSLASPLPPHHMWVSALDRSCEQCCDVPTVPIGPPHWNLDDQTR